MSLEQVLKGFFRRRFEMFAILRAALAILVKPQYNIPVHYIEKGNDGTSISKEEDFKNKQEY